MSLKAMSWLWDNSPARGTELLVLLALADFGGDDGRSVYPSIRTLAEKCRIDTRTVQRILSKLADEGKIVVEPGGGRGRTNQYRVILNNGDRTPPFRGVDKSGIAPSNDGESPPIESVKGGETPASDAVKGGAATPPEPLGTRTSPNPRRAGACNAHPKTPGKNCRRCGTSSRAVNGLDRPTDSLPAYLPWRERMAAIDRLHEESKAGP